MVYTHLQSTSNIASGYGKSYLCKLSYKPDPGDRNCKANDAYYDMCSYIRVRRYKHDMHHHKLTSGIPAETDTPAPETTNIFLYLSSFSDCTILSNVSRLFDDDVDLC